MSESRTVVGVVGEPPEPVRAAVERADGDLVTGGPGTVLAAEPTHLVAVGTRSIQALVAETVPSTPTLAVDAGSGVPSLPLADAEAGVATFLAGNYGVVETPVVGVSVDGERRTNALADVMLVTAEPARISEYAVATAGQRVAAFRADGVVVATPVGSHGYARRVDGPVVAPDTGVGAVVPVAPFATDTDHWVLPLSDVQMRVVRDEHDVELHADHRTLGAVPTGVTITVSAVGGIELATVPATTRPFGDGT